MAKDEQVNSDSKHYPISVPEQDQKVNVVNKSKQSSMPNLEHLLNLFGGGASAADGAEQIHERTQIMKRPRLQ